MQIDPAKLDPKYVKISFPPRKERLSRRDLLSGFLRPQYEIVPAVEKEQCTAWHGCSLCLASCPQEAIFLREGSASVDKEKCTGCGACLPSCPIEAISSPLLDPEALDSLLKSLLSRDKRGFEARILLITSEDTETLVETTRGSLISELPVLKLPCIGALSSRLVLQSFLLGAGGIAIIPCRSTCRHHCRPERWQRAVRFVCTLLIKLGVEPERVQVFSMFDDGPQSLADLLGAFIEKIKEISATRLRDGQGGENKLTLEALLKDLWQRSNHVEGSRLSGPEIPFGIVRVQDGCKTCTLCGACPDRCPTGAIILREEADLSQLLFSHSRCVGCGACVEVCPEQVLKMERTLDFSRLGEATVLAEDRIARCRSCGKGIAPLTMVRKIQNQVVMRKVGNPTALAEFCPNCRIFDNLDIFSPPGK